MAVHSSLRRPAMGLAGLSLVVGGTLGMVSAAGADPAEPAVALPTIGLHNATAQAEADCPDDGYAYWHFVFAPNNGSASFQTIVLNLGDAQPATFSGAAIVPNGTQTDNVFVAVPAGHELTDLQVSGSYAAYTGTEPNKFNLSHICEGDVPEQESTTTTTEKEEESTTTTTEKEEESTTTTTEAPEVEDTVVENPTTSTPTDATPVDTTPETEQPTAVPAEVTPAAATEATGTLPYTGTDTTGLALAGLAVVVGGAVLAAAARSRTGATQR